MLKTKKFQSERWLDAPKCKTLQKKWGLDYDEFVRNPNRENKVEIIKALNDIVSKIGSDCTVLEVGCGAGHFLWVVKDKVRKLIGLDFSPHMLQLTKKQFSKIGMKLELKQGSCWSLPFPDSYVDFSFNIDVNMHIGGSWEAIKEMIRVSRKCILFTGPSFESFKGSMDKRIRGKRWAVNQPYLESTLSKMQREKQITSYSFLKRTPTKWFNHRILIIEK